MASIVVAGDTSGTVTLAAPAVSGTTTLTLPTTSGTVLTSASTITPSAGTVNQAALATGVAGTGPAFSAYANASTSLPSATYTKITFDTEEFDTNSNFASSRFTPTVAGYYQINGGFATTAGGGLMLANIYKNGSQLKVGNQVASSGLGIQSCVNSIVYLNGSTDYVEIYGFQSSGSTVSTAGSVGPYNYFNGAMVRSA